MISRRSSPQEHQQRTSCSRLSNRVFLSVFLLLSSSFFIVATAQERPFVSVPKFDTSVSYRNNLCGRQIQLWNGSLAFPDALRGLNLTVALPTYHTRDSNEQYLFALQDGKIPEKGYPGYFAVILDEVARRAGFQWRNSFFVYEPRNSTTDGNRTWTDILLWSIQVADISMEVWGHGNNRLAMGVSFPTGFFDHSLVLGELVTPSQVKRVVDLWSFLKPFGAKLWVTILATVVGTGLVYYMLEHWNKDTDERQLENKPFAAIFLTAVTWTGHFELKPNTNPARIVGSSLSFWALIVSSSYTANLASFLVSPQISIYKYSTIESVLAKDATICMQDEAILQTILEEKYPEIKTIGKDSEQAIFEGLRLPKHKGGCDAVGHQIFSFELYERDQEVNRDCAIASEKRIVEVLHAGMATAIAGSCTSLVSHVLDYHLAAMSDDGFLEAAWNDHINRQASVECVERSFSGGGGFDEDDTFSLTIADVGGIFIVHVVFSMLAILMATWQFYQKWKKGLLHDDRSLRSIYGIEYVQKRLSLSRHNGSRKLTEDLSGKSSNFSDCSLNSKKFASSSNLDALQASDGSLDEGDDDAEDGHISEHSRISSSRSVRFETLDPVHESDQETVEQIGDACTSSQGSEEEEEQVQVQNKTSCPPTADHSEEFVGEKLEA